MNVGIETHTTPEFESMYSLPSLTKCRLRLTNQSATTSAQNRLMHSPST